MAGIRLFHPTARNGVFTFSMNKRPYRVPLLCPMCGTSHKVKTYHIKVDSGGFAFVSHEIWAQMKRHNSAGFELSNEVAKPPSQSIGTGSLQVPTVTRLEG